MSTYASTKREFIQWVTFIDKEELIVQIEENVVMLQNISKTIKKLPLSIVAIIVILAVFTMLFSVAWSEKADVKINIDGKELQFNDAKPFINEVGRTMVPIRAVSEGFGAHVNWNDALEMVIIEKNQIETRFKIHYVENVVAIRDITTQRTKDLLMDTKPIILNNRVFVPLRFVSQAFGYNIDWNQEECEVVIDTKNITPVFLVNPALREGDYISKEENSRVYLGKPINFQLTDEQKERYHNNAKDHVENLIGNVDYSMDFDKQFPVATLYPDAPFASFQKTIYDDAVINSINREVKFISDKSKIEVLNVGAPFAETVPGDVIIKGKLEFIYHGASEKFLEKFNDKLKKDVWYSTDISVLFTLSRGLPVVDKVILGEKIETIKK